MENIYDIPNWPENHILLDSSLQDNTCLFRYFDLKGLIALLGGNFYVRKRNLFDDKFESQPYAKKHRLRFFDIGSNNITSSKRRIRLTTIHKYLTERAGTLLTSCWTNKQDEDYLMWKCYTSNKYGAMIKASIHNIAASFGNPIPHIICAKIHYGIPQEYESIYHGLFTKQHYFESEHEVRFYIDSPKQLNEHGACFKINPEIMIDSITLSPFLSSEEYQFISHALVNKFPISKSKIHKSSIEINS